MSLRNEIGKAQWADMSHAYGSAEDTSRHLLALLSDDPDEYNRALDELWASICHQGSVYEASCAAVPMLINILRELSDERKPAILYLLAGLAHRDWYANRDVRILTIKRTHDENFSLIERQVWISWGEFLATGNEYHEAHWMRLAHESVSASLSDYLALLHANNRDVVLATLYLLAGFREDGLRIVPEVESLLDEKVGDEVIEAEALLTLGALYSPDTLQWGHHLARLRSDASQKHAHPLVKYVAAVALIQYRQQEAPAEALDVLIKAVVEPKHLDELFELLPSREDSVHVVSCQLLSKLGAPAAVNSLSIAFELGADRWHMLDTMRVAEALLDAAFFGGWVQDRYWSVNDQSKTPESGVDLDDHYSFHSYGSYRHHGPPGLLKEDSFDISCSGFIDEETEKLTIQREQSGLNADQRHALQILLHSASFWRYRHNLFDIYGLPNERRELQEMLEQD